MAGGQLPPNVFPLDIFQFDPATKRVTLKEGWRLVNSDGVSSLVDTTGWKVGGTVPPIGWNLQGSVNGNSLVSITDTFGFGDVAWRFGGVADEIEGIDFDFGISSSKMYRLICYVRKSNALASGVTSFGAMPAASLSLAGEETNANFLSSVQLTNVDGDLIFVGIIHPYSNAEVDSTIAGVYDAETFEKLNDGVEIMSKFEATTQKFRVVFQSSDASEYQYVWRCIVQPILPEQNTLDQLRAVCNASFNAASDQVNSTSLILPGEKPDILRRWNEINGNGSTTGSYWVTKNKAESLTLGTAALQAAFNSLYAALYTDPAILATVNFHRPTAIDSASWWSDLWVAYVTQETTLSASISNKEAEFSAKYLGRYEAAHPVLFNNLDWWVVYDTDDSPVQRGVWYSLNGTPTRISMVSGEIGYTTDKKLIAKFPSAMSDIAWAEGNSYGTSTNYGIDAYFEALAAVNAFITNLTVETAFVDSLFAQDIDIPDGGRLRFYNGQGVQRRCVELSEDHIRWFDTPDTVPATAETQRSSVERAASGGETLLDGDFKIKITDNLQGEKAISSTAVVQGCTIPLADGSWFSVYTRSSDKYIVQRTFSSGVWSSEVVVVSAESYTPRIVQLSDGSLLMIYRRTSDNYTVSRTYSAGSWGSEVPITTGTAYGADLVEASPGVVYVVFGRSASLYSVTRTNGTWGSEVSVPGGASLQNFASLLKLRGGGVRLFYLRGVEYQLYSRTFDWLTWSAETPTGLSCKANLGALEEPNGDVYVYHNQFSSSSLMRAKFTASSGTWGSDVILISTATSSPSPFRNSSGDLVLTFVSTTAYSYRIQFKYASVGSTPLGLKVGCIFAYSSSDTLSVSSGEVELNRKRVNIAPQNISFSAKSAGSGWYVCVDEAETLSLEAATATASTRPSDVAFSYNGGTGSFVDLGRNGYYINNKRIVGYVWKVSSTSFYITNLGSGQIETGENLNGKYEIDALGTMTCHFKNTSALTCTVAYVSPFYLSAAWIPGFPVPFKTGTLPDVTPGISESSGNWCMVAASGTPTVSIPGEFRVVGPLNASGKLNYTAIGKRPD